MGRASTQKSVDGFAAIFGNRRGSVVAQAQRDATERQHKNLLLEEWCGHQPQHPCRFALAEAYRERALSPDSLAPDEDAQLLVDIDKMLVAGKVKSVAQVLAEGDPEHLPGLTGPLLTALSQYFRHPIPSLSTNALACTYMARAARSVIDSCFDGAETKNRYRSSYYQRMQPLCEAIAFCLTSTIASSTSAAAMAARALAFERMAETFMTVPTSALRGPMRSWVLAFAQRLQIEKVGADEITTLRAVCRRRQSNRKFASAFAPIIELLDQTVL